MLFVCPICKEKLNNDTGRVFCPRGHSFDKSRGGYYNLLVGRGGSHGDNAEMVRARREFLSYGYYEPLRRALAEEVCSVAGSFVAREAAPLVVDAGCGEGYYTEAVYDRLSSLCEKPALFAFDISKDAAKMTARRVRGAEVSVSSAYGMPLEDGACSVLYNVFSPLATDEVYRVLKSGGSFIMAIAGEEHLFSLKEKIYDTPYKNTVGDKRIAGFTLASEREIRYEFTLDSGEKIQNLFAMTPYAYRTSALGRERVSKLTRLALGAHFLILHYKKD